MITHNRRWVLASRPEALIGPDTLRLENVDNRPLRPGAVRASVRHLSIDPTIRTWMDDTPGYLPPIEIGRTVRSVGIAEVVETRSDRWTVGEAVFGPVGWQEVVTFSGDDQSYVRLPQCESQVQAINVFGNTGMAAYIGITEVGQVRQGDVVVVSGAAGATGSLAGQIARLRGAARVVGIAGGPEKCATAMTRYGFDAMVDYKSEDVAEALAKLCPAGIDLYFDNVGGKILDAAVENLALRGRIALCGAISSYAKSERATGAGIESWRLILRRARAVGFIILDYPHLMQPAREQMAEWLRADLIRSDEHVLSGLETAPEALNLLFTGGHSGKVVVTLAG